MSKYIKNTMMIIFRIIIICAIGITSYRVYIRLHTDYISKHLVEELYKVVPETGTGAFSPDRIVNIDGYDCIGMLNLHELNKYFVVLSQYENNDFTIYESGKTNSVMYLHGSDQLMKVLEESEGTLTLTFRDVNGNTTDYIMDYMNEAKEINEEGDLIISNESNIPNTYKIAHLKKSYGMTKSVFSFSLIILRN